MTEVIGQFRAITYDQWDTDYAFTLCRSFEGHSKETQASFNAFTNNLMNEKQINRNGLLNAIEGYDAAAEYKDEPLMDSFRENAWNYRPNQPCTIS